MAGVQPLCVSQTWNVPLQLVHAPCSLHNFIKVLLLTFLGQSPGFWRWGLTDVQNGWLDALVEMSGTVDLAEVIGVTFMWDSPLQGMAVNIHVVLSRLAVG